MLYLHLGALRGVPAASFCRGELRGLRAFLLCEFFFSLLAR